MKCCQLGHTLVGNSCIACTKPRSEAKSDAAKRNLLKAREASIAAAAARAAHRALLAKRAARRAELRRPQPCPLHSDSTLPCDRCARATADISAMLADVTPVIKRGPPRSTETTKSQSDPQRRMHQLALGPKGAKKQARETHMPVRDGVG